MKELMFRVLLLLMCVSCLFLTSCRGKKGSPPDSGTAAGSTSGEPEADRHQYYTDRFGSLDMKGQEVWIYDLNTSPDIHVNYYDDNQGDTLNVKLHLRDSLFEELYGIRFSYFSNTAGSKAVSNSVLSGLYVADIIYGRASGDRLTALAQVNCLSNLRSYEALSFSQPWWGNFISDSLTVNNRLFFTSGDILPSFYQSIGCFFYNINQGTSFGIDKNALCVSVESGQWTWELLSDLSKDAYVNLDANEELTADADRFGFLSYNVYNHTNMFAIGAGLRLCEKTADGSWTVDFDSAAAVETLGKLARYMDHYSMGENGVDSILGDTFKSGRAVFAEHFTESAFSVLRNMQDDYLMLPVPKLEQAQEGYRCMVNSYVNCFVGILSNCADKEVTGAVLESMAHAGYYDIRPVVYETLLKGQLARDPLAINLVDLIFDTAYIDYGVIEKFGVSSDYPQGASTVLYQYLKEGASLSSEFAKIKGTVSQDLQKFFEPFEK